MDIAPTHTPLQAKMAEFDAAYRLYVSRPLYPRLLGLNATLIVALQAASLGLMTQLAVPPWGWVLVFVLAYFLTDLLNGLIHLYMDNNDNYRSVIGPFVAAFHVHHKKLSYDERPLYQVYFLESGPKSWLAPFILATLALHGLGLLNDWVTLGLLMVGILSSVAEVSHFICHNRDSRLIRALQAVRLLLPRAHHARHHQFDNVNYAFLNGLSDPFINGLARRLNLGYRDRADCHSQSLDTMFPARPRGCRAARHPARR